MDDWAIVSEAGELTPCPFCGGRAVIIASPLRFGIQCDNPECLALVYTDYRDKIYQAEIVEKRKLSEHELQKIMTQTIRKWNRRQ